MDNQPVKEIKDLFSNYRIAVPSTGRHSERGDLITKFLEALNPPRLEIGLKPLSPAYISWKFASVKMGVDQIYRFYKDCERAKNFSSYFWYAFKIQIK